MFAGVAESEKIFFRVATRFFSPKNFQNHVATRFYSQNFFEKYVATRFFSYF